MCVDEVLAASPPDMKDRSHGAGKVESGWHDPYRTAPRTIVGMAGEERLDRSSARLSPAHFSAHNGRGEDFSVAFPCRLEERTEKG